MDWLMGKGKRKDKDSPPPTQDEYKQYLEDQFVQDRIIETDFYKLVTLPPACLDCNEWLATHTISFFNHVNLMYGVVSEYCTSELCASMTGPGNVQYSWHDEKGKKYKESAPQYIDYVTLYIQKTIADESVFPTKFGQVFPSTFEATVKRIHKYLFHIIGHIYHVHYKELLLLAINGHMNTLFTHFMVFSVKFDLVEDKEYDVLSDLVKALIKQLPDPNQNEGANVAEVSRT